MTVKRFKYDNGNLFDNKMNTFYQIEDTEENIELFCMRLNELAEENEQLKAVNEYLIRLLESIGVTVEIENIKGDEGMAEKRFNLVDLLETLAIADGDECRYYQNCDDDFMSLCKELNTLHENEKELLKEIEQLKSTYGEMEDYLARLEEENKQLKRKEMIYLDKIRGLIK